MKAMILRAQQPTEGKPLEFADLPWPGPGPRDLVVKVSVCGVCRTDLHIVEGDLPLKMSPIVPGHQIVGTVAEAGKSCSRFKIGDRVGAGWLRRTCGLCPFCMGGRENLCESSQYTGYSAHGGYAESAMIPEDFAYRIPEAYSDEAAAPLLCGGIIGYRALKKSNLPSGGKMGIFGFGSSAHIVIQILLARESEVYVITRDPKHQDLAKKMGATWTGASTDFLQVKLDSAIIFAPAGELVPAALRSVGKGGTVVLAGIHMSPTPSMSYEAHLFHEKQLVSVESNTREDGRQLFEEAAKIHLVPTVTLFSLEEANEALLRLKHDKISGTAVLKV